MNNPIYDKMVAACDALLASGGDPCRATIVINLEDVQWINEHQRLDDRARDGWIEQQALAALRTKCSQCRVGYTQTVSWRDDAHDQLRNVIPGARELSFPCVDWITLNLNEP